MRESSSLPETKLVKMRLMTRRCFEAAVAGGALAAEGEEKLFPLAHEVVPAHEHIGHDDDPNDKVEHTDGGGSDPFHDVRQGRERVILEPGTGTSRPLCPVFPE